MAAAPNAALDGAGSFGFGRNLNNKILLAFGVAAVIAVMTGFWLWSQQPDYRVLFSNYSDKDGGAIVAALEQMNVPYKFSEGGSAILVPSEHVAEARLKVAAMGLPKGGNVGFELLENQKFGVSQFVEQVNFQRALEGELERSIQAIGAVQNARVHLAIPKSTVFVRDEQKPTASILINLHPGRTLDPQQVSAVVHLVASSVPELTANNVTLVDQNGNLLSDTSKKSGLNNLDPSQLKYIDDLQQSIIKRVESIIAPMVGEKNVHAEANAEIDFSTLEQAAETYKPNQEPDAIVIRSQQSNESQSSTSTSASGVPGALSNQPPANATAPITSTPANTAAGLTGMPGNTQKNVTTNYEVDKTIRYVQQPMGGIKRLTVAVVVNDKQETDKKGKVTNRPLTDDEKKQITELAKQAMGFSEARGDSLSVVNTSFAGVQHEDIGELPIWKQQATIDMAKDFLKMGIGVLAIFLLYKRALKPMVTKLTADVPHMLPHHHDDGTIVSLSEEQEVMQANQRGYQQNLEAAKMLAKDNPKMVANVVTAWVSGNE